MRKNSRKLAPVIAAAALVLATIASGVSPASAATVRQGTKCAVAKSTKIVGAIKYTCTTNPVGKPAGLSWTMADCLSANTQYLAAKAQNQDFITSQTSTLAAIKASIDASKHSIDVLNQGIAAAQTNEYIVGYNHLVKPAAPIKVVGIDAAIAAVNKRIVDDTAKRDNAGKQRDLTATLLAAKFTATQIAGWAANPVSAAGNPEVNVQNYGNWIRAYGSYDSAITNAQRAIATLQKVPANFQGKLVKAQAQVDSMTLRYNQAIANQPTLAQTIKAASDQALSTRKSACMVGL